MSVHHQIAAIFIYIAAFSLLCALFVSRNSRIGWAFSVQNFGYFLTFFYGFAVQLDPIVDENLWLGQSVRIMLAVVLTWAFYELIRERFSREHQAGVNEGQVREEERRGDEDARGVVLHEQGVAQGHLAGVAEEKADEAERRRESPRTVGEVPIHSSKPETEKPQRVGDVPINS